uniref:Si:ch73-290k24.6 n=1 Tax=Poecilia formosa TaxID=48698 RepID=A0A087XC30_POEFO
MEYHSGGSLPLLGRPRYCPGANANGGYLCETGHCCGETGCCTYYYELWWFWLLWTVLILFSCCCAYRHRRAKLRVQQQQRQREISLLAYHGANSFPSSMLDLSFLASLKLPSYEEVAAQPSTPPPPYSSVFTTPRYPQPPRAADPHLLTQHGSDNSSSCSCDSCCPSSPCSSSLSAPITYETDTSHASTPRPPTPTANPSDCCGPVEALETLDSSRTFDPPSAPSTPSAPSPDVLRTMALKADSASRLTPDQDVSVVPADAPVTPTQTIASPNPTKDQEPLLSDCTSAIIGAPLIPKPTHLNLTPGHASSLSPSPRATQSPPKQTVFSPCVDVFEPGPACWEDGDEEQAAGDREEDEDDDMGADESQYRHRRLTGDSGIEVCRCRVEEEEDEDEEEEEEKDGDTDVHDSVDCPARSQMSTGDELTPCNPSTSVTTSTPEEKVIIVMETV